MGKSVRGGSAKEPIQPKDFFSQFDSVPDTFGNVKTKETIRQLPSFNAKEYENIENPTPYDESNSLDLFNAQKQGAGTQAARGLTQFGANFLSGVGQGLANLVDVSGWANDNYQSTLFGYTTKDMQDWASSVAQRNDILRENPGSFSPTDFGWLMEQVGSAGTGVGMGAFALLETIGIEAATGGLGTGVAVGRLMNLFKKIKNARGTAGLMEAGLAVKELRSTATIYGIMNRTNESRMEAMMSYDEIYNSMTQEKNADGSNKYSEEEAKEYAAAGADRTFAGNMALLPLDILAFRAMVYNPISGSATGLLERGLSKIGNKALRKTVQFGTGAILEGTEEGFQFVASNEGKHYAKVLGGQDDGSSLLTRLGKNVSEDEFWNNFAGGIIGSPIIGGVMNLTNKVISGNRTSKLNSVHANYVQNIGKMDNAIADKIKKYQEEGKIEEADVLRRQFRASKALGAIHLDALTDRDGAFNSHLAFLEATLEEVNAGKTDALQDLGFLNPTEEQIQYVKDSFQDSINDAKQLKTIYDNVAPNYNKNFVPEIAQSHFQLAKLQEADTKVGQEIAALQAKLFQFEGLSSFGKERYDINYKLEALVREQARLTQEFQSTENAQEKENVNQVLEGNKVKLTQMRDRLEELNKEPAYTANEKDQDNDILLSALRDRNYATAMQEKEHLQNAIALQRKNISLWNSPQYQAEKTQQSIKKAKTVQQVESTEQELAKKGNVTPETAQAIADKKNEINAQAAASVVEAETTANANGMVPGNANLFAEDNNLINSIITVAGNRTPVDNENQAQSGAETFLLSPAEFDFEASSPEAKAQVQNGIKGLLDRLEGDKTFEGLVRHVARVQGYNIADDLFNALKWGWEANGNQPTDYNAVYNKIFGNPMDELLGGVRGLSIKTPAELEKSNDKTLGESVAKQNPPVGFDNNNQPVYKYTGIVTNESSPKMAFTTRLSEVVQTTDETGAVVVSNEYTETELNVGDYVDSLQLLDPDKYNEGTEMTLKVPANFNDIKIPVYNADGSKGQSVTFGQYVATNNLTPDMQEYKDKLPIIIYKKGAAPQEKGLAFVHDIGWYHPLRFHQEFADSMQQAIDQTREVREAVIAGNGADVVITSKRQTTFSGLKTKPNETVTLKEANPDTQLTVALTTDSLSTNKTNRVFPNNTTKLMNQSPFSIGRVYDVRRYGKKDGVKTYMAFDVIKPKLDTLSKSSVMQAINMYALRGNKSPEIRGKHDPIVKQIQDTMGLDILSAPGLEKYLQHFITTFNTEKATTNEQVEAQAKAKLAAGTPFIAFIAGGNIVMGRAGEAAFVSNGVKKYSYYINPNSSTAPTIALSNLSKANMLGWFEQNLDLDALSRNKPVVTIDQNLVATTSAPNYNEFLLSKFRSNIKSYNIGTPEQPNYVTNIQPVITYELKSKINTSNQSPVEEAKSIAVATATEEVAATQEASQPTELSELERKIIEEAKRNLGTDFGASATEMFSPAVLTEEQRQAIGASINRIAGLTPDQQFDLVDFMYNQITAVVNFDTKQVTRAEIDKIVDDAFKAVVEPLKTTYKEKVAELEKTLAEHPALLQTGVPDVVNDYKFRLAKIQSIEDSFGVLKEEAYNRVAKYTGITQNKVQFEAINDEQNTEQNPNAPTEEDTKGERDFWTDILQENPESRLSYSMRRFFGQIREYDKNGNPVTGFLGLPTYTGSDTVIRNLMVTLADVPSDFNIMMAKLEERKAAVPWMQEVIDKLQGATAQQKQQFVTVMSNTSLRMKFTMISFNRKNNTWTTKVWDTHMNGVADAVKREWAANFKDSQLVMQGEEGDLSLNDKRATALVNRFEGWIGKSLLDIPEDMTPYRAVVDTVKVGKPATFSPTGTLLQWLKTNAVSKTDRVKFSMKGFSYQVTNLGNDKFQIEFLKQTVASKDEVRGWLNEFGIVLTDQTLNELMERGLFHNYQQRKPNELFDGSTNTNGLLGILYNNLKSLLEKPDVNFTEEGNSPMDNSVINSLANLEAKYNNTSTPFGFRDNGKSFFALTAPKFITDRVRDLKTTDSEVVKQLMATSFSQNSMWLTLLQDEKFRDKFNVAHIGANAFKELGKKLYRDNAINKLADVDHELTKLGMFWDMNQGEITYNTGNYPGTNVAMRMATMFSPTMSDKHMMTLLTTAVLNLTNADLNNGTGLSDPVKRILYEQTVKPELQRMIKFWQNGGQTNISSYDAGAALFLMLPGMNTIEYAPGLKLIDAIKHQPAHFTMQYIENNTDLMDKITTKIGEYVDAMVAEKLEVWTKDGLISTQVDGNTMDANLALNYFDKKYMDKFRGTQQEKVTMAAMDFVVNYMISNSNSFMTMAGDPAMYFKSKSTDPIQASKDTFVNVGKRLANQIAPGTTLSNSENEKYLQVFLDDRKSLAETPFLKFVTKINDGNEITDEEIKTLQSNDKAAKQAIADKYPISSGYFSIEGSDAQEYTTWKEHLDVLAKLGKTPDTLIDITPEDIMEARTLFATGVSRASLTEKQLQLIGKVMQPIKPVYTGQIFDPAQDVMRTVYIKSSSFPLIPQLTAGMEIDKLRIALEKLETKTKMNVRASYQTANKVGAVTSPIDIWNQDGTINSGELKSSIDDWDINDLKAGFQDTSALILDRKNFRIQQDVPFKSGKVGDDKITLGTQLMKLLFGDEIMNFNDFTLNGKQVTGKELHRIYNDTFINLVKEKRQQLFDELGLNESGVPIDLEKSTKKLQTLLKDEAVKRGYPLQDIEGLSLTADGQFNLPLWASTNSNRYESMLNSIVSNRLIRMKMPGNSFVVGSEEGFIRAKANLTSAIARIKNTKSFEGTVIEFVNHIVTTKDTPVAMRNTGSSIQFVEELMQEKFNEKAWTKPVKQSDNSYAEALAVDAFASNEEWTLFALLHEKAHETIKKTATETIGEYETRINNEAMRRLNSEFKKGLTESFDSIDKSRVIWTSAWNGKNLQATYHANGELKKAQVLMASKFKTPEGELIDLFTKVGGEYKYITQTDTGFNLKEDMFDKELLSMITFRIPTSGHQSASQVEIAGFLPAESADLMIVPRNFTKQKGLDFDVDKENAYHFWTFMNEDGKFEMLQEKHRNAILAKADKLITDGVISDSTGKLFAAIFGDEYSAEEIKEDKSLAKVNSKINEKLMQNEIIKINHSVLGSNNDKVQAKINKTLNTDFAEAQAEFIDQLSNASVDSTHWTPLSDEYQKQKMMTGASGKIGTGAYSLDVVFHSLVSQLAANGKAIQLTEMIETEEGKMVVPKTWRFGNMESSSYLGQSKTIDGGRSISEVMGERQNVAVDNEKLQIMGRVNLNDITMDVDKVMNMVGFDKGSDGNSISFLFLSQPIIKEFVEKLKNAGSNLADFETDKEGKAFDELIKKYEGESQVEINDDYWKTMSAMMTNGNFIAAIGAAKPDGKFQAAVLRRFMEMRKYGLAIRGVQSAVNTDSKGLGKSFFDVIEKKNALNRLGEDTAMISGASNLIGDFIAKDSVDFNQRGAIVESGYTDIGEYFVKPDTLSGAFNIYGVTTAYNMWNNYFPYDAAITNKAFEEILGIIASEDIADGQIVEKKQEIFREMKKYFAASKYNGIIQSGDDINAERARIFIDSDTNTSLAKYIKTIKGMTGNSVIDTFIKTNKLINRFEFEINKNGQPSLIKYNNAAGEEFDEQYLYESLSTLMEVRGKSGSVELPEVGNKKYTLDTLAQDLIAYAYLGNAVQEAIQFTKYVPVSYLNQVGYSEKMRAVSMWLRENPNILGVKIGNAETDKHLVSEFTMQYIQHNPERVRFKLDQKNFSKSIVKIDDNSFTLKGEERPTFVSVYDSSVPKGEKKFKLFWFDGAKYVKIPVLGTFGMDEYQVRNQIGTSLVNGKTKTSASPQSAAREDVSSNSENPVFDIETGDSKKITEAIANNETTVFAPLAKALLEHAEGFKVVVSDTVNIGTRAVKSFNGHYNPETKTITIHSSIIGDSEELANTFLHELIHGLSYNYVSQYVQHTDTGLAQLTRNDTPAAVQDLVRLYNNLHMNVDASKIKSVVANITKGVTEEDLSRYYGFTNIHEFMTMALTDKGFQEVLSKIEYKQTDKSFLDIFKGIISRILQSMGVVFDEKYTAVHAINSIFTVIDVANAKQSPKFNFDIDVDGNQAFLDRLDEQIGGDTEATFLPANERELIDLATAAIITDIKAPFQPAFLSDVRGALREAAIQANSSTVEAEAARRFYGNDFIDIAIKMFPDETAPSKNVQEFLNNTISENKRNC